MANVIATTATTPKNNWSHISRDTDDDRAVRTDNRFAANNANGATSAVKAVVTSRRPIEDAIHAVTSAIAAHPESTIRRSRAAGI